ncbi:MAG: hypothetical protein M3Y33_02470 [Actinomycetota bacterium]|nr:hypothetical protein [Actinomycetota bacterium]
MGQGVDPARAGELVEPVHVDFGEVVDVHSSFSTAATAAARPASLPRNAS